MLFKKTSLLCVALALSLIIPLTACGEKSSQEPPQTAGQPEMSPPTEQKENVSHVNSGMTLTIPGTVQRERKGLRERCPRRWA